MKERENYIIEIKLKENYRIIKTKITRRTRGEEKQFYYKSI